MCRGAVLPGVEHPHYAGGQTSLPLGILKLNELDFLDWLRLGTACWEAGRSCDSSQIVKFQTAPHFFTWWYSFLTRFTGRYFDKSFSEVSYLKLVKGLFIQAAWEADGSRSLQALWLCVRSLVLHEIIPRASRSMITSCASTGCWAALGLHSQLHCASCCAHRGWTRRFGSVLKHLGSRVFRRFSTQVQALPNLAGNARG